MVYFQRLLFTILLWCTACASITDRHQYVRIVPPDSSTEVYYDGQRISQGEPQTLQITRTKHPRLFLKKGTEERPLNLETEYRWGQSFAGNLLLVTYAPMGWLIDFLTGAAWEAKDLLSIDKSFDLNKDSRLFVMPPTGMDSLNSQLAGKEIIRWFQVQHPGLHALPYEQSYYKALGLGFDHESSKRSDNLDSFSELMHKTKITHIVFSHYDEKKKSMQIEIFSPYSAKVVAKHTIDSIHPRQTRSHWNWLLSETFEVIPNTISIGSINTNFSGCANNGDPLSVFRYCAHEARKTPLNFISAINLTNVLHYRKRQIWGFYLRFYPDLNASYNEVIFSKATPSLPDLHLDWAYLSLGYGPRLSFVLPIGEIFFELTPFIAMNYLRLHAENYDNTQWVGKLGATSQIGLHSWLSSRWNLRIFGRFSNQNLLVEHDLSRLDPGTRFDDQGLGIIQGGISVGYYFMSEKARLLDGHGLFSESNE